MANIGESASDPEWLLQDLWRLVALHENASPTLDHASLPGHWGEVTLQGPFRTPRHGAQSSPGIVVSRGLGNEQE